MVFFGGKHKSDGQLSRAEAHPSSSLFDNHTVIAGTVSFKGKARIDGIINGDITEGAHLILSETGEIIGNIKAVSFNCYDTLEGAVHAGSVIARKTCTIHGRIEAANLTVEPGAAIDGEIRAAANDLRRSERKEQAPSSPSSAIEPDTDE